MNALSLTLLAASAITFPAHAQAPAISSRSATRQESSVTVYLTKAANGTGIPHPASTNTHSVTDGTRTMQVPEAMVYVPAGKFTVGAGASATTVDLDGYCIGKFPVTNAEYKEFLDATGSKSCPPYWVGGTYPAGKANHPVVYVSLTQALAYAAWVSEKSGWKVTIPTSNQWEEAARGPKGWLYPWGDSQDAGYSGGVLTSKFNYNAVTAAHYLKNQPKLVVTYNKPEVPVLRHQDHGEQDRRL